MKVEDLMTTDVRTVGPDASLKDVAALLAEHRIGGVPVVDEGRRPLGVITKADIVMKELADPPVKRGLFGRKKDDGTEAKVAARTAGMASLKRSISPSATVASSSANASSVPNATTRRVPPSAGTPARCQTSPGRSSRIDSVGTSS